MTLWLNAYPLIFDRDARIAARQFSYDDQTFRTMRAQHTNTHAFYRMGNSALCISADGKYPIAGEQKDIAGNDHFGLMSFLIKDGIVRLLKSQGRSTPIGFSPIEIVSTRDDDNIIEEMTKVSFPFAICAKYGMDVRNIKGVLHLIIDCSTKCIATQSCKFFNEQGFDLTGRFIVSVTSDGYRKLLGTVTSISGDAVQYQDKEDGSSHSITASLAFPEASRENFDDYVRHQYGDKAPEFLEKVRTKVSVFNGGANKRARIERLKAFLDKRINTINGISISLSSAREITKEAYLIDKTFFVFSDNLETSVKDGEYGGLKRTGPYTKRTFDHNDPSICIICSQNHKGQIEQFVRKFLKGIPKHKYFTDGLEGKFCVGTSKVEVFTFQDESVDGYKTAIEAAIKKKTQDGGKWDLALVQVRQAFKDLVTDKNPYYVARSFFLLHQVPVQDFTLELLKQEDRALGYSLNNMALASYAKMGGVPWLLKSSPTISHELVIGIGSASLFEDRLSKIERIMGITTVFSGDGSYIVSNTSKAVTPDQYSAALVEVLQQTIEKVKKRLNWQHGDTIRIVFHASVKKFNRDEIDAVKRVIEEYREYNVEYAFLKISDHHGLHMFDSKTATENRGKFAPPRGQVYKMSDYEALVYLIGHGQLKQATDGHPRGLILSVHKDSTFKDIKYLAAQLFNFSAHSWRSYFPNPMPVTITYSDLIAHNLGWLNKLPGWNSTVMYSKIGQTQWFL